MTIAYWVLVFLGAFTLVVEAYRQFSVSTDLHHHDRYPILKGVNVQDICTPGEHLRGFLVYVTLYLSAYATILGSAEVYDIVTENTPVVEVTIGATIDAEDPEQLSRGGAELAKPIFISSIIIAALSMGIFAPVERALRAYAHWIAGIPRGIYRVINLMGSDMELQRSKFSSPLSDIFDVKFSDLHKDPWLEKNIGDIKNIICTIDLIEPLVTGEMRSRLFTAFTPKAIDKLISTQKNEYDEFDKYLHEIRRPESDLELDGKEVRRLRTEISELLSRGIIVRNNFQALFSILYLRNERQIDFLKSTSAPEIPVLSILKEIDRDRDPAFNALAGALIGMFVMIAVVYSSTYFLTSPPIEVLPLNKLFGLIRNETVFAILFNLMMFGTCAAASILTRETSKEYGRWKEWRLNEFPFGRFAKHCMFPGFTAVMVCVLIKLIEYTIDAQQGSFDLFVRTNWAYCAMQFVSGAVIALCVFTVLDQHGKLKMGSTIALALAAMTPYYLWAIFVQSLDMYAPPHFSSELTWRVREIWLLIVPPTTFAIFFAVFLELSEDELNSSEDGRAQRPKLSLRRREKEVNRKLDEIRKKEAEIKDAADIVEIQKEELLKEEKPLIQNEAPIEERHNMPDIDAEGSPSQKEKSSSTRKHENS